MANPEHLAKLKEGVVVWNVWRRQNSLIKPDLTEADLRRANLFKANLRRANLTKANLTEADLTKANLTEADLFGANLTRANLFDANLTRANLTQANLRRANLTKANGLDSGQLCSASSLFNAKLDDARKNQAMNKCPEKFKKKES